MNKKIKLKAYAVAIRINPKPNGSTRYVARTFRGIALAIGPKQAKEQAIKVVLKSFSNDGGSSVTISSPIVNREDLTVKECKLYGDFIANEE